MASHVVPLTTVTVNPAALALAASTLKLPPVTVSPLMSAVFGPPAAWAACGARIAAQLKIATIAARHTHPTLCLRLARLGKGCRIRVRVVGCRTNAGNICRASLPTAHNHQSVATSRPGLPQGCSGDQSYAVVAGGGIGDGNAIARAIKLATQGVSMGTPFVASEE